jgi:hypothetical protein
MLAYSKEGEMLYFNSKNISNMPRAYATRTSISFPLIFSPKVIDVARFKIEYKKKENIKSLIELYIGAFISNSSIEIFINAENLIKGSCQEQNS